MNSPFLAIVKAWQNKGLRNLLQLWAAGWIRWPPGSPSQMRDFLLFSKQWKKNKKQQLMLRSWRVYKEQLVDDILRLLTAMYFWFCTEQCVSQKLSECYGELVLVQGILQVLYNAARSWCSKFLIHQVYFPHKPSVKTFLFYCRCFSQIPLYFNFFHLFTDWRPFL